MRRDYGNGMVIVLAGIASVYLLQTTMASTVSTGDFDKDFFVTWSPTHINTSADGHTRTLKLDPDSGAAMASNQMFLFGQFDMKIKLIPGNSAGTVVAFYLTSDQPNRDEVDFEFLGNVEDQPYTLQTNVFANGFDNREERIHLWFDPTKDFHTYSIFWNIYHIVFMVDWVPIRVYRNHGDEGVAYPRWQPMSLKISLWNGESWATRGGEDKIDWSKAPFMASFENYRMDGCVWEGDERFCRGESSQKWWNKEEFSSLSPSQRRLFKWVRKYYLTYDYCDDKLRFLNQLPKECSLPKY